MIVHLTGSSRQNPEDLPYLRKIADIVKQHDVDLAQDWIATIDSKAPDDQDSTIIDDCLDAIFRSDIVIIEASSYRLSQGYQLAISLQMKRPTLVISRNSVASHSLSDIKNRLLSIAEYGHDEDLEEIVAQFITSNTISTKDLRFNMFIDRPIYNYLRSVSYESGKNKSEIIRDLINREIAKKD